MALDTPGDLYRLFAHLLEYPTPALARQAEECGTLLSSVDVEAAALMERFRCFTEQATLSRLEELYTATFDLQAVCYPYLGYHLFGESYKRGMFMAQLNEGYRERGFSAASELPDHVAVVLRFLAYTSDGEFSRTLLNDGLLPTLDQMVQALGDRSDNPYAEVVRALLLLLRVRTERGMDNA